MTLGGRAHRCTTSALAAALALALLFAPGAGAAQDASLEYAVKANYLVRFGAFAQWPARAFASPSSPVVICIQGHDPFGAVLDRAAEGQTINGRPVQARRLARVTADSGCHLVYLGRSSSQSVSEALAELDGAPVLTVTDSALGPDRGVIHFAVAQNRVRFHVDDRAAARGGLTISSRLLGLALSVRSRGGA